MGELQLTTTYHCSLCGLTDHNAATCEDKDTIVVLVLDTETTGMDPAQGAEVIEVAVRMGLADDAQSAVWKIKPLNGVPADSTAVHGVTEEMTRQWPTFGEIADEIATYFRRADVIVGYNPDFDVKFMDAEFRRAGLTVAMEHVVICGKRLWDKYDPPPARDLQAAYRRFVDPQGFEGAHGALMDARATAQVVRSQLEQLGLQEKSWVELDPERANWWGPSRHVIWDSGQLVCNFGKNKGIPFHKLDNGMLGWIKKNDFPQHVRDLAERCQAPWRGKQEDQVRKETVEWAKNYKT